MKRSSAYEKLALIYAHVMEKVRYSDWADYIHSIADKYVTPDAKVLELAGGNCSLANHLSLFYPDLIVTDYSKHMLQSDKMNILPKVCCDMTALPFKSKFNFIYSTFDSINYLTTKRKLSGLFKSLYYLLADNGIFTFDASLERNSYVHIRQPVRTGRFNNIDYVHRTIYDANTKIHKNVFKIKLDDGSTFKEIHSQRIYPFEEYFRLIEKAGLYVVDCLETFTYHDAKPTSDRAQFIVSRPDSCLVYRPAEDSKLKKKAKK